MPKACRAVVAKPATRRTPRPSRNASVTASVVLPKTPDVTHDLVSLASHVPAEILQQLATAIQSGRWLLAVWHIDAGRIEMKRTAANFPTIDLDQAVTLLDGDLKNLKPGRGPVSADST